MRAVVDTNIWISAFLNPHGYPARVYAAARTGKFEPVTSRPLLDELAQVLARPRLQRARRLSTQHIDVFVTEIEAASTLVPVTGTPALCRDPDDDVLLETAINGHAAYVVSRDEDLTRDPALHEAATRLGVQIMTVAQFLQRLAA
jgi:uncharacterized protein